MDDAGGDMYKRILLSLYLIFCLGMIFPRTVLAYTKGIYITQSTAQNYSKLSKLIRQSKAMGINTFIIDVAYQNTRYAKNMALVRENGINYVARIVVFPHGGSHAQVRNRTIWEKRWRLAQYAVDLGARSIQLDYIRYSTKSRRTSKNIQNIQKVIQFFKDRLKGTGVSLEVDVFGEVSYKPSRTIGQNARLFAKIVDVIAPMVYPSHYHPARVYSKKPYKTVYDSIHAMKEQLSSFPNVKVVAFIEASNFRYRMSRSQKSKYIKAQMRGAKDAGADGWYVWSPRNHYNVLFSTLGN